MPEPRLVYWDSCIFIEAIQQEPSSLPVLSAIVRAAQAGDVRIVTSALTLAEVVRAQRSSGTAADEQTIRQLFDNPYIVVRAVTRAVATDARAVSRQHGVKPPDAIHVATALAAKVSELHTRDGQGRKRGLINLSGLVGTPPLTIAPPRWAQQQRLLSAAGDDSL